MGYWHQYKRYNSQQIHTYTYRDTFEASMLLYLYLCLETVKKNFMALASSICVPIAPNWQYLLQRREQCTHSVRIHNAPLLEKKNYCYSKNGVRGKHISLQIKFSLVSAGDCVCAFGSLPSLCCLNYALALYFLFERIQFCHQALLARPLLLL